MNSAQALWTHLTPDAQRWFGQIRQCVTDQHVGDLWTSSHQQQALALLDRLELAWHQERVDLGALQDLERVSADLGLSAAISCRASLEAIRGHLKRLVESTYEALTLGD